MSEDLRNQIRDYMDNCPVCVVATASVDGQPSAATVYFKRSGLDIYFNAARDSQKVQNILANPRVAITRYIPFSLKAGIPMTIPLRLAVRAPMTMAGKMGIPDFTVR